jgi:hypothetical protein
MSHVTKQQPASGATLGYAAVNTGPFTNFPQIVDIKLPTPEQSGVSLTLLASTIDTEGPTGIPKMGEVTFKFRWDPADVSHQLALNDAQGISASRFWQVSLNDTAASKEVFPAWVKSFDRGSLAVGAKLEGSITLVITDVPAHTDNGS